jgi:2-oxoisovalerate dehydrogenase E1 component
MTFNLGSVSTENVLSQNEFNELVLNDYYIVNESRQASLTGRKEVLTGKAKFGIFGDGKELAQIAMAKVFQNGDFRAGYYRDQTFMMAIQQLTVQQFFAQLYAHTSVEQEPASGGRSMNGHFGTRLLDENGMWLPQTQSKNSSSDISPTAGQMPRLLGLAYASKLYRNISDLHAFTDFSISGNEVAFGTIGNASTSEGHFFEALNAAGVLQVPMVISVWDDEYGISVHAKHQTTKQNISEILKGFQRDEKGEGFEIFTCNGWDYPSLCETYFNAEQVARKEHVPVLVHVREMTQPQGHSTSGSHERYKSKERLEWEQEFDCIAQFRKWILSMEIATEAELEAIEEKAKNSVKTQKKAAWDNYTTEIKSELNEMVQLLTQLGSTNSAIASIAENLKQTIDPVRKDIFAAAHKALRITINTPSAERSAIISWLAKNEETNFGRYNAYLFTDTADSPLKKTPVPAEYPAEPQQLDGREVLNACFDANLSRDPRIVAFGEDVGKIGDVNQGFAGLQDKHGELRVSDMGIREQTIVGQAVGLSLRGLRPIAEIQYLDYLLYGLQTLSDDVASLSYRTARGQKYPLIIRTRGHRLEGIWHSGSPIGMMLHSLRGMHVLVPRNMTQAAGFYNNLLRSDEPAIVVECLNGYRLKEALPSNVGDFILPLGKVEKLSEGTDLTLVTYGSSIRIAQEAMEQLTEMGISVELIDVQSLLPFDLEHEIVESVKKTNRLVVLDEDVPGGASSYILQQILEEQNAYPYLDSKPITITAKAHRPAYGTDGDYFSKPSAEEVFEKIYALMHEVDPNRFTSYR